MKSSRKNFNLMDKIIRDMKTNWNYTLNSNMQILSTSNLLFSRYRFSNIKSKKLNISKNINLIIEIFTYSDSALKPSTISCLMILSIKFKTCKITF